MDKIMCGGSSAKTDRKTQLSAEGDLDSTAKFLKTLGPQLITSGTANVDTGLSDTSKASRYYSDILSGDPSKVMSAVAPEVNAVTGQAEQEKKALTIGGNRAGGTNASTQDLNTKTRSIIGDMISRARGGAASGLERTGAETSRVGLAKTGEGIGAEGTAGSEFASLISDAISSRQVSQKIHDQAVEDWGKVIGDFIMAIPTGGTSTVPASTGSDGGGGGSPVNTDVFG